jgi:hypothetical protein
MKRVLLAAPRSFRGNLTVSAVVPSLARAQVVT